MSQMPNPIPPEQPSRGVTSSEFWKGMVVTVVAGFVVVWGTIHNDRETMEWGLAAAVGTSLAYTASRTFLKR